MITIKNHHVNQSTANAVLQLMEFSSLLSACQPNFVFKIYPISRNVQWIFNVNRFTVIELFSYVKQKFHQVLEIKLSEERSKENYKQFKILPQIAIPVQSIPTQLGLQHCLNVWLDQLP